MHVRVRPAGLSTSVKGKQREAEHRQQYSTACMTSFVAGKHHSAEATYYVPCAVGCVVVGWPQRTNGGSGLTTTGRAPGTGLMLKVPMPPGSACFVCCCGCCCLPTPDAAGAGFSSGCRKSCVFRKKPAVKVLLLHLSNPYSV